MAILPKLLFKTLPIPIPAAHFRTLQSDLIKFFWNYKRHRIAKSILYTPRGQGGLVFPNVAKYYLAAQLRLIASWCTLHAYNRWTQIEKLWLAPTHPNSMLWSMDVPLSGSPLLPPWSPPFCLLPTSRTTWPRRCPSFGWIGPCFDTVNWWILEPELWGPSMFWKIPLIYPDRPSLVIYKFATLHSLWYRTCNSTP